jgi:fructuronate reductase
MNVGDRDWAIIGVSLRSAGVHDQLAPQAGLYTVTERNSGDSARRMIGAIGAVLVAPRDPWAVVERIASASTHIVSLTVTEKGYLCSVGGGLDWTAPALARERSGEPPSTLYGLIAEALQRRRVEGLPGLSLLSCDNLAGNGATLKALLEDYLQRRDPGLARWFAAECACPSTMVDRIAPATTETDRAELCAALGLRDEGAVVTEPFSQWVIEDRFAGPRPRWEVGGAQLVGDVTAFEYAKLRMLNGAHSALAYLGLFSGHIYVHQAIADPTLRALIEALMAEAARSFSPAPGQDLDRYAAALVARFSNSALAHRLDQIAMDGSQKIPQRWLRTLAWHQRQGRACPAILRAMAAWIAFVRGDRFVVVDPMAEAFAHAWRDQGMEGILAALFSAGGLFTAAWTPPPADRLFLINEVNAPRS